MKITIVTATFNSAKTLKSTLDSVLAQSYSDFEHLIIDGGSRDETMDIIREYESRYQGRLRYISEPDNGIYDAMNKGIAMASGDVVGILNSDDFFTCDTVLSEVVSAFDKAGDTLDAVYGDIHYVNDEDLTKCVRYYSSAGFRRWKMRMGWMPAHPSFYCRKRVYEKYGSFDISFKIGADFENLLRLIFVNKISIKYLPLDFVTMRTGGASTSGMASHKQIYQDHRHAYKKNSVYSNFILEGCRYVGKVWELLMQKF